MAPVNVRRNSRKRKGSRQSIQADKNKLSEQAKSTAPQVIWRVIAPFVSYKKKPSAHTETGQGDTSEQFSFYLQKKPTVLLRDLSAFLSDSVDLPSLLHETADVLQIITKSNGVTLYMINTSANEIYFSQRVPVLDRQRVKWKIEEGTTVAAYVAKRKEYVIIEDILKDKRFPEGIGSEGISFIPYVCLVTSVLCVPIVNPEGDCFAVIEMHRLVGELPFQDDDLKLTIMVTAWMGAAIYQNQQRLALKRQQELNDYLLDLTKCYFAETVMMEKMIIEIVKFAKVTLGAERGSVFIIDKESDELVADLYDEASQQELLDPNVKKSTKLRFGKERGIAGLVARTGVTVNIKDAYNDSRFNKEIDQKTGFITRSILCMPVVGVEGILGVVQVINKKNGGGFTSTDENLFKTFSVYCALALHYARAQTQLSKNHLLTNIYQKLVRLQQKPCIHDTNKLFEEPIISIPPDFHEFTWYIKFSIVDPNHNMELPQYCLYMFTRLIDISEMHMDKLMMFVLTARKLYRENPYHNFEHAFNVCHCMYAILKRNMTVFSSIEVKALMVATLCHDLDHVGFTNNFLQLINDSLAQLYKESVLENHHLQLTKDLLTEYEIFPNLSSEDFGTLIAVIEDSILATDLSLYFKFRVKLSLIYTSNTFDWQNEQHRILLKNIAMTSCDLSGQCKPYEVGCRLTNMIYAEFYHQGDLEKKIGLCPLSIMDREKQERIPEDQVQFLSLIVVPCVDILRNLLPNTEALYTGAITLRRIWQEVIDMREHRCWRQQESIVAKYRKDKVI